MKKLVGYIFAIAGLAIMVFGFGMIKLNIGFLGNLSSKYVTITSVLLIIIGVAIVLTDKNTPKKKEKQSHEEVPIYQGEGKNRRIVGYKRE